MAAVAGPNSRPGWFAVPAPVRELFKLFPLTTLPADPLPERAPERARPRPRLYVFARSEEEARGGRPSFNPQCLKWQTFLRIAGVEVDIIPSNNHASPSGALPFLLPPTTPPSPSSTLSTTESQPAPAPLNSNLKPTIPLTGSKIERYAKDHSSHEIPSDPSTSRIEAYEALLSQSLRPAWLYTLYLDPLNTTLLSTLYLPPSPILQLPSLHTLRNAATAEILKTTRSAIISPLQLLSDATDALRSLSALLSDDEWFFGSSEPGLFDAEVFAYTHLILDPEFGWADDNSLTKCLAKFGNLVEHRRRLYESCWPESQGEK
ncbi:hypothetical protein M441DRAFT_193968 [Trichoderma asperellum CBS 433.97]|uniref:Thioredoxin-like fold domain-containing protein n=1 Tax=Trichoderma asperellum (strain ATCC 204424 / CBS 433.97 / NBRC 101777) TaxID=1042311 RepID=A0A2T3Z7Q1_TRIA4|nr:hypothetical protein M441DRAFT_193968 [Trichoderma asperellum CBS 433.97]PTB40839.1 hypothetical protein M441DRAFT_193968 [Trichoderma asperellum CBS 433.97]